MLTANQSESGIAIYWDFENIHAALVDDEKGFAGAYSKNRRPQQEALVEIDAVMNYASSLGTVVINRAFANWQSFAKYRFDLLNHAIDLVQLYSPGSQAKNGADIRLALEALEDIYRYSQITHVVIVGGDSDYISLAQKCRQNGKIVIGIGVRGTVNRYWIQACNEFKFYKTLLGKTGEASDAVRDELKDSSDPEEARNLLQSAVRSLTSNSGQEQFVGSRVKLMMSRLDPSFDEGNYGFSSFTDFLKASKDIVEVSRGEADFEVSLVSVSAPAPNGPTKAKPKTPSRDFLDQHSKLLNRVRIKPVEPQIRVEILKLTAECFKERTNGRIATFRILEDEVYQRAQEAKIKCCLWDVKNVRYLLFRLNMFKLYPNRGGISLWLSTDSDVLTSTVEERLVKELLNHADPPVDLEAIYRLTYGSPVARKSREYRRIEKEAAEAGLLDS